MMQSFHAGEALAELLTGEEPPLDHALLLFSESLQREPGVATAGLEALDALAKKISDESMGIVDLEILVRALFDDAGFGGDVEDYHGEDNSFLDRVMNRRVGMPITLSAIVVAVGQRLGIDLHLVGLPGHVVVGVPDDPYLFIDAYSGALVGIASLEQRLANIFQTEIEITHDMVTPMSTINVITRVNNNLLRTWSDEPAKTDRLLELDVLLPLQRSDQRRLVQLAEARGRFDIAALLRAKIDPGDPKIGPLWARLN